MRLLGAGRLGFLEVVLESLGFGEVGKVSLSIWASGAEERNEKEPVGGHALGAGNSAEGCQVPEVRMLSPRSSAP